MFLFVFNYILGVIMSKKYFSFVLLGLITFIHLLAGASEIDSREKGLSCSYSGAVIGTNMEFAENALHKKMTKRIRN